MIFSWKVVGSLEACTNKITWTLVCRWLFSSPCASSVSWILSLKLLTINTIIIINRVKCLHLLQTDQAVMSSVQAELSKPDTAPRKSPDFTLSCQGEEIVGNMQYLMFLSICLFVFLSFCLFVVLSLCLFFYFFCLFVSSQI